jgi:hypothetical protein
MMAGISAVSSARGILTVSGLARSLPHKWVDQERMFGLG